MSKALKPDEHKTATKNTAEKDLNGPGLSLITWDVFFGKDLTTQEIDNEQPLIESFLTAYLTQQLSGKAGPNFKGSFNYAWKRLSILPGNPATIVDTPVENFQVYSLQIRSIAKFISLGAVVAPGDIYKFNGVYKRGKPKVSSRNPVKITPPRV